MEQEHLELVAKSFFRIECSKKPRQEKPDSKAGIPHHR